MMPADCSPEKLGWKLFECAGHPIETVVIHGKAQCRMIKVTAVTHRKDPMLQTCIGPSEEHVSMAGIPTEASIIGMIEKAMPGVRCHPLDPSNDPDFSPSIRYHGIACKTIFDCTVPFSLKERFQRAQLLDVDPSPWMSGQTVPQEPSHWKPI